MSHYVICTGGRDPYPSVRDDIRSVLRILHGLHGSNLRVLHGAAQGVDAWTDELCEELGIVRKAFPADWDRHGRAAGPKRNIDMITKVVSWIGFGHTAQVLAFPGGVGTAHCATTAEKCGLDVSWVVATEAGI